MATEDTVIGKSVLPDNNQIGPGPNGIPKGPPPGYKALSTPTTEVGRIAKSLLGNEFGTLTPFSIGGTRYLARVEPHFHPLDYKNGPTGWHKGVTVYEKTNSVTEPKPARPTSKKDKRQELFDQIDAFLEKFN